MPRSNLLSLSSKIAYFASILTLTSPALALQPLEEFLAAARSHSFDAREQSATVQQRDWEKEAALGRLLPSFSARGVYTHNQAAVELPAGAFPGQTESVAITPRNQLDAFFQLDVPLVDLANSYRYGQAQHLAKAARAQRDLVGMDLDRAVTRAYYTLVGASALVEVAERSVGIAEEHLAYVTSRFEGGVATELDRERARANLERSKQDRTDAELTRTMAARTLETFTKIQPTNVTAYPVDDLSGEAPLQEWLGAQGTPQDRVQAHLEDAALAAKKAAKFSMFPTLSANAQERLTNATGFAGRADSYTLQAVLSWRLDYGTYANAEAQVIATDIQKIRAERARRDLEDAIFDAYQRVQAGLAKSASARAQAAAARKAEHLALQRYQAGVSTQLDVTQAQRDAFQAEAARLQADADLALARVTLRIAAGKPVTTPPSSSSIALESLSSPQPTPSSPTSPPPSAVSP